KSQYPKTSIHFSVQDQSSKKPYRGLLSRRSLAQKFSLLDTVIVQDTRERQRQRSVNQAFGELRLLLPTYPPDKKLSKHEILRSSIKYIHVLEAILKYQEEVDGLPPAAMSTPESQKRTHLCRDRTKQLRTMITADERLVDLEHADDIALVLEQEKAQVFLDDLTSHPVISMRFAFPKFHLQLKGRYQDTLERFNYFRCISSDCSVIILASYDNKAPSVRLTKRSIPSSMECSRENLSNNETDVADMRGETPRRWQPFRSLKSAVRGCLSPPRNKTCCEFKGHNLSIDAESLPSPSTDNQTKTHSGARFVSTGFSLIGYTFFLQLGLHLMTFVLKGLAYHRLDTASLGLVNVRLGLFYTTLMFISRDAFRRAFLSRGGQLLIQANSSVDEDSEESIRLASRGRRRRPLSRLAGLIDLAWAILPLGMITAVILLTVWIRVLPSPSSLASKHGEMMLPVEVLQERYVNCLLVYALSGLFELSTEPFWLICQLSHLIGSRIVIEALANLARAVGIAIAIFTVSSDYAIYSLALPQILHGTTLLVAYLIYFSYTLRKRGDDGDCGDRALEGVHRFRDIFPRVSKYEIDRPALKLARSLFGQGLLKQLLTEGELYLISAFNLLSFTNQGIYDMVNNIGSIATRLLFLPMEESCHFVFNQCLVRNIPPNQQDPELLNSVFRIFRTVLRTCSLVAWIGVTFAQANSCLLLTVYVGPALGENVLAVSLLRLYAAYVLLLAWNGSTEAFLNAAMSSHEVSKHNERLIIFSFVFLGANWLFVPWLGAHGFVVANCINMFSRIAYSCYYINRFVTSTGSTPQTDEYSLRSVGKDNKELENDSREAVCGFSLLQLMFPSVKESIVLLLSLAVTLVSEHFFCCTYGIPSAALHATITACALCITLFVMFREESDLLQILRKEVLRKKIE
ncbi:hypothetical protein T265_13284, partial [Opisthorchis viverrini]